MARRGGGTCPLSLLPLLLVLSCPVPALVPLVVAALCNVGASAGQRKRMILLGPLPLQVLPSLLCSALPVLRVALTRAGRG